MSETPNLGDLPSRVRASGCASHEAGQHCGVPCPAPLPADCWRRAGQVWPATFQGIGRFFTRPAGSMGEEVETLRIGTGYCCAKAVGTGRQVCDECASFDPGFDPPPLTDAERYAFVRKLGPAAFLALWEANVRGGGSFDALVDAGIAAERGVRT